ncbi:MAG: DUF4249 domain-containing protein [Prevotellaceae bacterium]|jgi:hypothetical protein|nr:DUF4249 domain-containing protein [Prevotellaceae bacterium]
MKRNTRLTAVLAAPLLLLAACVGKEIPYTPAARPSQLIMNALLESSAAQHYVYLYQSGIDTILAVRHATVTLSVNGQSAETGEEVPQIDLPDYLDLTSVPGLVRSSRYRFTTPLRAGDEVTLDALTADGSKHASATLTVPRPVNDIRVDTVSTTILYDNSIYPVMQYRVTLTDLSGEANYYRLDIRNDYTSYGKYYNGSDTALFRRVIPSIINFEEPLLSDGRISVGDIEGDGYNELQADNRYNIFTDKFFTDRSYTLKVYTALPSQYYPDSMYDVTRITGRVTVRLLSITEAEYNYLHTLNLLEWGGFMSDMIEPLIIPSNVTGGTGFVGAGSDVSITLELPDLVVNQPSW